MSKPADTGLPRDGAEERERLKNTPLVVLQADLRRSYERRAILEKQLRHVERRIERLNDELRGREPERTTAPGDDWDPFPAPGYS